jgi:hypothetical protein
VSRSLVKLVALVLCLLVAGLAFGQDKTGAPSWNGQSPSQAPPGFVAAHTFYWMLGVGATIVGSLTTVIGVLWSKLNKKEEDERKDVLVQITLGSAAVTKLAADWADEKTELRDLLKQKDERLEKQHDKTLKIAVRAQQAVEALANLPIGDTVLDDEE